MATLATQEATPRRVDGYAPIEDYAAIGDGRTLALVAADGAIDWLCLPELASESAFGAVLDPAGGGSFTLAPAIPFTCERRYLDRTNVLETTFRTAEGALRVTDAITRPAGESPPGIELVRKLEPLSGSVPVRWRVEPRPVTGLDRHGDAYVLSSEGRRLAVRAWGAGEPTVADGAITAEADVGEPTLIVVWAVEEEPLLMSRREDVERRLAATADYWRRWVARVRYDGDWATAVERSLLAIGLLTDERTGAIAAAGTTSLPEKIGGERNFDYRYAWARDLSFTLDALLRIGLEDVAHKSFTWLLAATRHTHPRVDPVYRRGGTVLRGQAELPVPGYRLSRPAHRGNQAATQLQLGGFGDVLETAWMYARQGGLLDPETGARIADVADLLGHIWRNSDAGIWEIDDAQYISSKVSCWTAFDRVLRLAEAGQVPARHVERWRAEREAVRDYVEHAGWSEARRSYVQRAGSDDLDAALLLAARRGYADPRGKRMNATIDAIRSELGAGGPLLYRYSGMREEESAFLACSFWAVEALAMAGRFDEAASTMEGMVALANDVGLYSEEIDPSSKGMRGNLPQALTHLALVNAAVLFEQSQKENSK